MTPSWSTILTVAAARTCPTSRWWRRFIATVRIVAFVANIAHHSDVGGKVPGSESSDCTSIFQEGIRLPPVRLFDQGRLDQGILDIILLNSRTPREREGDLKAQIATNLVGRTRVEEIFGRFGTATTLGGIEAWLDYSESRARAGIRELAQRRVRERGFYRPRRHSPPAWCGPR